MRRALTCTVASAAAVFMLSLHGRAQGAGESRLDGVTAYVEQYYGRAQSLVAEETVTLEQLRQDLTSDGLARRLTYEIRVEWSDDGGTPQASVVRQLLRVGNRPAKPGAEPECLDPKGISPEPLAFLLKDRRDRFRFRETGMTTLGRRNAVLLDYRPAGREQPTVTGDKECISIDMPSRTRGRVWLDPDTHAVLRLDEGVVAITDVRIPRELQTTGGWGLSVTVERHDSTIEYVPVTFTEPDETLLLPTRVESVSVIRANRIQRLRVRQTYRNYRRFLTQSRLIP
jgi:hypothetical protein